MNFALLINLTEFVNDLLNQDHMCEWDFSEAKINDRKIYYQTSVEFGTLGCNIAYYLILILNCAILARLY